MESNGERNRIQVSQKTADLIELANKGHWLTPRKDKVNAKGKGQMQTYWCEPKSGTNSTGSESQGSSSTSEKEKFVKTTMTPQEELMRLVEWNVDLFEGLLKKVMANQSGVNSTTASATLDASAARLFSGRPLDEVTEIVSLPKASPVSHHAPPADTKLSTAALEQLRDFILSIAEMHRANPFHNFDHCCHVTMATMKLLNRIALENCPYGISSDPLTQFAVAFGSLMHDVDHPGVSNAQLVQENAVLAVTYDCKSVSEQHSDVAWNMFMEPRFADLRACIYSAETELKRFRQVVINIVMATDFFDKDVEALRESRWNKSFCIEPTSEHAWPCNKEESDRRAAIILDIIIQAADISHAMQHFTVYKKWSLRLLAEMYNAYKSGRSLQDPIDGWYERELTYFDSYVIPLSAKLRKIGVFGASCDEFLDYAKDNRVEWEMTGREIVREANEALEAQALGESLSEDLMKCASHE